MRTLTLSLLAASLAAVPAGAANLVTNGSFEQGSDGLATWTLGGNIGNTGPLDVPPVAIFYNNAADYPNGAYGEAVPPTNVANNPGFDPVGARALYFVADGADDQTLTQTVNVVAGTNYTVGFDYYLPQNGANNANGATLRASIGNQSFATFNAAAEQPTTWKLFRTSLIASTTGPLAFTFTYNSFGFPAKDFVIDRVFLAPTARVPEPASWALMIGGFGMLGAATRGRRSAVVFA